MSIKSVTVIFLVSQTPWLLLHLIASFPALTKPLIIVSVAAVVLPSVAALIYKLLPPTFKQKDGATCKRNLFYYMCCVFTWSCMIDLIIFFEAIGVIQGYMDFYLKKGEPYLGSPFGVFVNLWDAVAHYLLYLTIIYKYDNQQNFRDYGLYWSGSMFSSMFCLIIGAIVGSYGTDLHLPIFLNIPYIILPIYAFMYLMKNGSKKDMKDEAHDKRYHKVSKTELFLICVMILSIAFGLLRGFAVLGSPLNFVQQYVKEYEPYLMEPGKFGAMHCLLLAVYGIPIQVIAIHGLWNGHATWLRDISLVYAGTTAQGTFFHLGPQLYSRTDPEYVLGTNAGLVIFLNLMVVTVSHLWAYYCCRDDIQKKNKYH